MSTMISEVYDAFREVGVSEERARAAAEALTELRDEPWKRNIERELANIRIEMEAIRGTLRLHNWMLTTNIALTVAVLFRLLTM